MSLSEMGKIILIAGLVMAVIGLLLMLAGKTPLSWLGHLPGDFSYRGKNFSFYFPLATCLVISIILTLLFWLINRR